VTPTNEPTALAAYQPTDEEKVWGLVAHVSALAALFLGPLIALVVKGNESKWVKAHAIESLNFSITIMLGYLVCIPLLFVLIGWCLFFPLVIAALILHIIAGVAAFQGRSYRYPWAIRLIKE
jgi:uncharacterized Tic20 family protein